MTSGVYKHSPWTEERKKRQSDRFKKVGYRPTKQAIEKARIIKIGKHRSEETKMKLSKALTGKPLLYDTRLKMSITHKNRRELNNFWKGGVTNVNIIVRSSVEYKLWREAVFKRDNYTCVWCGSRNGNGKKVILNADHIKPFALFPELRFAIDNGRTLCVDCHKTTISYLNNGYKVKKPNAKATKQN